jgi:methylated-DNA-[protein]-cysteine S-methyltransferase
MNVVESFYSDYLGRFVRIVVDDDVVREISLRTEGSREPHTERVSDKDPSSATGLAADIHEYLRGGDVDFSRYTLDLEDLTEFEISVINEARKIPKGSVMAYSELARAVGRPRAARAVGNVMRMNAHLILVPCHRVVGKHDLGGFSSGLEVKRKLLRLEGYLKDT